MLRRIRQSHIRELHDRGHTIGAHSCSHPGRFADCGEQRLLASVREVLGQQVKSMRSAPVAPDSHQAAPFDPSALVGIPVAPFTRWMVCPWCRRLAPLGLGLFKLETPYRTDQIRYVHANCSKPGKPPTVVPARFIVACKNGHFDDFPWRVFVHDGPTDCQGGLKLLEPSATGEAASIFVQCEGENCGAVRPMSDAFKADLGALPACRGRRPHLRDHDEGGCKTPLGQVMRMEPMLQGASNSWFGITLSALAIPQGASELGQLVDDNWTVLEKAQSEQNIDLLQQERLRDEDVADGRGAGKSHDRWVINKIRALGGYYTKGFDGGAEFRNALNRVESIDGLRELIAIRFPG